MNFALVLSQVLRAQVCGEHCGAPGIYSRPPTKALSEVALKREEMPALLRPRCSIFMLAFMVETHQTRQAHSKHLLWIRAPV